jgi:hypothetical protein
MSQRCHYFKGHRVHKEKNPLLWALYVSKAEVGSINSVVSELMFFLSERPLQVLKRKVLLQNKNIKILRNKLEFKAEFKKFLLAEALMSHMPFNITKLDV